LGESAPIRGKHLGHKLRRINIEQATEICYKERKSLFPARGMRGQAFGVLYRRYNHCSSKEKQIWVIRERKIKAKENNRRRPSVLQRKNED
jgi:hypothetical protein